LIIFLLIVLFSIINDIYLIIIVIILISQFKWFFCVFRIFKLFNDLIEIQFHFFRLRKCLFICKIFKLLIKGIFEFKFLFLPILVQILIFNNLLFLIFLVNFLLILVTLWILFFFYIWLLFLFNWSRRRRYLSLICSINLLLIISWVFLFQFRWWWRRALNNFWFAIFARWICFFNFLSTCSAFVLIWLVFGFSVLIIN